MYVYFYMNPLLSISLLAHILSVHFVQNCDSSQQADLSCLELSDIEGRHSSGNGHTRDQ